MDMQRANKIDRTSRALDIMFPTWRDGQVCSLDDLNDGMLFVVTWSTLRDIAAVNGLKLQSDHVTGEFSFVAK